MMRHLSGVCTVLVMGMIGVVAFSVDVAAQDPDPTVGEAAIPVAEAAAIAQYWVLMAEGRYDEAALTVGQLLSRYPRNIAVLSLLIEVDIAHGGATAALTSYEAWLGTRTMEEPGVVRRVARAMLYEWSRQATNGGVQSEALQALVQDGEADAVAVASAIVQRGDEAGVRMGVRLADSQSVAVVADRIRTTRGLKLRDIQLLSESHSQDAVSVLIEVLADPQPENRTAAADALGKIGGAQAEGALRPVLSDPHGGVRTSAAAALFRLGNFSGANILNELAASDSPAIRRTAAMFMASQPDEAWKTLVRNLLQEPDPVIRLDAARLIAPHDPELARAVLEQLSADPNLAIREETELVVAEIGGATLADLRALLRLGQPLARVRAARRILEITR
ncbi:MAG: HEAT repeat domain-containing protein [Acidobacteria bacterium]|nr:HEAT repeat domain-containing protein [Acidobacteriota bacterium]